MDSGQWDRACGAWYGQLVGDALGSMVEFEDPRQLSARYPGGISRIEGSPVWGTVAGQPTDDSELAMALAHALIACEDYDPNAAAVSYRAWLDSQPFDCGATIYRALSAIATPVDAAGQARAAANPASQANGALMRHSVLGIWGVAADPERLAAVTREDTRLTHPHQVCQDASVIYTATLARCIRTGAKADEAYRFALAMGHRAGVSPDIRQCLESARTTPPPLSRDHAGWVLVTLHNAFYQVLHADSLERGVSATAMLGGDADTNAAVAGALLGAVYGAGSIPAQWRQAVAGCRPARRSGVRHPRPPAYWPYQPERLVRALWDASPGGTRRTVRDVP